MFTWYYTYKISCFIPMKNNCFEYTFQILT